MVSAAFAILPSPHACCPSLRRKEACVEKAADERVKSGSPQKPHAFRRRPLRAREVWLALAALAQVRCAERRGRLSACAAHPSVGRCREAPRIHRETPSASEGRGL